MNNMGAKSINNSNSFKSQDLKYVCEQLDTKYYYEGDDLGCIYTKEITKFRVWAPTASKVSLSLYHEGLGENRIKVLPMIKDIQGTWVQEVKEDLNGIYYTYLVTVNGDTKEAVDPYAKATGANGQRGMVIDLDSTNPKGWDLDKKPELHNITDAIIYEAHIRDLASDSSSNIKNVGKFIALTETGTTNDENLSTGLDHLKELGITHLHLLPIYDYGFVDETNLSTMQFNWGYDPVNYNVPEGSYSTDPFRGEVRIKELKQMVSALHANNIRVVMDVVYNHTYELEDSNFNKIVPYYYYRFDENGFTDGSACGNETASERKMVRKYIVDSIVYWAKEYHIDGFRFDLMGLHDINTMKEIKKSLEQIDPSIIVYGEGWTAAASPLKEEDRAISKNAPSLHNISFFNDHIRDAIKGNVFLDADCGFINGGENLEESIKSGVVGAIPHPQVDKEKSFTVQPSQSINYVSAHDNLAFWDKITISTPNASLNERIRMNKLSSAIIFTSQGIPFFQAGEEILRSKVKKDGSFDHNSFRSEDSVNSIKWYDKTKNIEIFNYYKGLIAFRKSHPALRMTNAEEVRENITFIDNIPKNVIAFTINKQISEEKTESIFVIYNARNDSTRIELPQGRWNVYVNDEKAGNEVIETIEDQEVLMNELSAMVLVKA